MQSRDELGIAIFDNLFIDRLRRNDVKKLILKHINYENYFKNYRCSYPFNCIDEKR